MQLYPVHPEECRACLIWAFEQSETEQDLVRNAAHILAELCIKGNLDVHAYLFQRQYMPEQAYGILDQCFDDLNQEPKNTAAKRLLLYAAKLPGNPAAYRVAVLSGAWASRSGRFTAFCGTVCKPG